MDAAAEGQMPIKARQRRLSRAQRLVDQQTRTVERRPSPANKRQLVARQTLLEAAREHVTAEQARLAELARNGSLERFRLGMMTFCKGPVQEIVDAATGESVCLVASLGPVEPQEALDCLNALDRAKREPGDEPADLGTSDQPA